MGWGWGGVIGQPHQSLKNVLDLLNICNYSATTVINKLNN